MMAVMRGCSTVLPIEPGARGTSFLPCAHIADRGASHYTTSVAFGFTLDVDRRFAARWSPHLPAVRPTAWRAVPRVWEKIEAAL